MRGGLSGARAFLPISSSAGWTTASWLKTSCQDAFIKVGMDRAGFKRRQAEGLVPCSITAAYRNAADRSLPLRRRDAAGRAVEAFAREFEERTPRPAT